MPRAVGTAITLPRQARVQTIHPDICKRDGVVCFVCVLVRVCAGLAGGCARHGCAAALWRDDEQLVRRRIFEAVTSTC
jgi:hypothetical protein